MKKHLLLGLAVLMCGGLAFAQPKSASAPVKLVSASTGLMTPVWSPDGSQIAMTGNNYTGIMVANADGSGLRTVTDAAGAGYKMVWNGNNAIVGRTNIVESGRVMHEICQWNLDGAKQVMVQKSRNAQAPSLRAAGLKKSAANIYDMMMAKPAEVASQYAALKEFEGAIIINPALSPNGKRVAFQVPGKGMWVINADGSDLRYVGNYRHASWMPDNATIACTVLQDNGSEFTASTLYATNVDNGKTVTLTENANFIPMTPAVSPDGMKIAFENAADQAIYVITLKY